MKLRRRLSVWFGPKPRRPRILFRITAGGFVFHSKGVFYMDLPIDATSVSAALAFVDKKGNPVPAVVQGVPGWTLDVAANVSVTPAADGLSAVFAPLGPTGTTIVTVAGSVDYGVGAVAFTASGSIATIPGVPVPTIVFGPVVV